MTVLTGRWPITYYRRHPAVLLCFEGRGPFPGLAGLDDDDTPRVVVGARTRPGELVFDPCMGRGLTATTTHDLGRIFRGSELHPRRMSVTLAKLHARGLVPRRLS